MSKSNESYLRTVSTVGLATARILDEKGESIALGSLWSKQPAILIFLRHFACVACRAHAADVWNNREKYEGAGAKLYFIGNGAPEMITVFKQDLKIEDAPIFTDPSLRSFRAAGFKRGFLRALGPKALLNGQIFRKQGSERTPYTKEQGDVWQLGGIVAVKPGGLVTYHYVSVSAGDYPPEEDLKAFTDIA